MEIRSVGLQILPTILLLLDEEEGEGSIGRSNAEFRHLYYNEVIRTMYGPLGVGNRREVPKCCLIEIHNLFPEEDPNSYIGYKQLKIIPVFYFYTDQDNR